MAVGTLANIKVDAVQGIFTAKYTADATAAASSIFCGFTPRVVEIYQIGGSLTSPISSIYHESMAAGSAITYSASAAAAITAAGVTLLTGTEASPAAAATNSPASGGAGFTISTGVTGNSLVYLLKAIR